MKYTILFSLIFVIVSSCKVEDLEPIDRFVGTYDAEEYSFTLDTYRDYEITIRKVKDEPNLLYIRNFYDTNEDVFAETVGSRLIINKQQVSGAEIEGFGSINLNKATNTEELTIAYSAKLKNGDKYILDSCNTICIRR